LPSSSAVSPSKKKYDFMSSVWMSGWPPCVPTTVPVAVQRGLVPPPGSCPKTSTLPSVDQMAEWPIVTPGTSTWCIASGSVSEPPSAGSRLRISKPVPPAQPIFLASALYS
jgi:hypothetical protein